MKFIGVALLTTLYMWLVDKNNMFEVVIHKPKLWVILLFVYSLLSVFPQEIIYRTFFFRRYQDLFNNEKLFIFINAIVFALGHIFFKNALVIILTFLGGILFALTFKRTKSTLLVSIEHAIYGCWLFTVGMGSMLGFPN
jgi:membrane protease YdiL (CAAX protease family)